MTAAGVGITNGMMKIAGSTFETQDALAELKSLGITDLKGVEGCGQTVFQTPGPGPQRLISSQPPMTSNRASRPLTDEGVAQFTELAGPDGQGHQVHDRGDDLPVCDQVWHFIKGITPELSDLEFGEMFAGGIATAVKAYKTTQLGDGLGHQRPGRDRHIGQCARWRSSCPCWACCRPSHVGQRGSHQI